MLTGISNFGRIKLSKCFARPSPATKTFVAKHLKVSSRFAPPHTEVTNGTILPESVNGRKPKGAFVAQNAKDCTLQKCLPTDDSGDLGRLNVNGLILGA
jgi:hypothetical protein